MVRPETGTARGDAAGSGRQKRINFTFGLDEAGAQHRSFDEAADLVHNVGNGTRHDFYGVARHLLCVAHARAEGLGIDHEDLEHRHKTEFGRSIENLLLGGDDSGGAGVLDEKFNRRRTMSQTVKKFRIDEKRLARLTAALHDLRQVDQTACTQFDCCTTA